jgi:hypothetical protein
MNVLKSLIGPGDSPRQPNSGRRSFIWKMGAAMSAALASAASSLSSPGMRQDAGLDSEMDRLSHQLGILEDEKAIRALHQAYEVRLDTGLYEQVGDLFDEDGTVVFNGGVFTGKSRGIARLYSDCFRSGLTGRKIGPAPDSQTGPEQPQEIIEVAADRLSARSQFPYSIQVGTPMAPDAPFVDLARLHGGGIMKWCESGVCETSYAKDPESGGWKIKKLEYRALSKTDYRPGKLHARPISVPQFSRTFPEDPSGPDRIISRS